MSDSKTSPAAETSLGQDLWALLRHWLSGRRGLIALAAIALAVALPFGWGWLVAAGLAPLVIALLPCAAMCALGLCLGKRGTGECSTSETGRSSAARSAETPVPPLASLEPPARPATSTSSGEEPTPPATREERIDG